MLKADLKLAELTLLFNIHAGHVAGLSASPTADDWTAEQLAALSRAWLELDPTAPNYWQMVAARVRANWGRPPA